MNKMKKSMQDAFQHAAGVAAAIGMMATPVPGVAAVAGMAMGAAVGFSLSKKSTPSFEKIFKFKQSEDAEISVETGAPVKAMRPIRLRR